MKFRDIRLSVPVQARCSGCGNPRECTIAFKSPGTVQDVGYCCSVTCWDRNLSPFYGSLEFEHVAAPARFYAGEPNFSERRQKDRRNPCNECEISKGKASYSSRHEKHCYKYRIDGHVKQESTFSAYGGPPICDGPGILIAPYGQSISGTMPCPKCGKGHKGPAQSLKIEYSARERTSYPIPKGYRILNNAERMKVGDMIWNLDTEKFDLVPGQYIDFEASGFICPLRSTDERPAPQYAFEMAFDKANGRDRTARAFVLHEDVYNDVLAVIDVWGVVGTDHLEVKRRLGIYWPVLARCVEKLARNFPK